MRQDGAADRQGPLVSCLMVTRGDVRLLRFSLTCFLKQDYPNRELLVVTDNVTPALEALVQQHADEGVTLIPAPDGLTLGDLRNFAAARVRGEIVCQWDDDDLSDPSRIAAAVQVLQKSGAAAAFLNQWTMWWPARRLLALSSKRLWEGTMFIWRQHLALYPARSRGEDAAFVRDLKARAQVVHINAPAHYCYVVTGQNTWDVKHFEQLFRVAERHIEGPAYDAALEKLALRLPIREYAGALAG